ncbi:sugar ABC transporter ATP-binding protein [Anaerocolumna sp.]|uniref:sugar ABC transporter ATP-binding protein n=1 Tax=Anaerocolumna sp. TaxID=2041569 RepID=UPI0028AC4583|nr:sugar ABC transporter ATP-binding protein [Anaerocolumna sp.]
MGNYVVELKNVTKRFPGVVALRDMSLQIKPGEILGLIGENGAGKSTLIKVLTGVHSADEGEIFVNGVKQNMKTPSDAKNAGIACVYQELNIIKELSITDNIFINKFIHKNNSKFLDYKAMHKKAHEVMLSLGQDVDVTKPCANFGMGILQMVEIAKAVLIDAKLIIMDEPTSSLGEKEVRQLMKTVRSLKEQGVSILFVSHKLEELFELCDRVTVMRDGEHITTDDIEDMDNDKLITAMVGRTLNNQYPKIEGKRGKEALRIDNLNSTGVLHNVSFTAYHGEILGIAGLVGAGRTETFQAIFGAFPIDGGQVYIEGKKVTIRSPKDAVKNKVALLTEDRKGQGLVLSQGIDTNLILANLSKFTKGLWLNKGKITSAGDQAIEDLKIKTPGLSAITSQLSGGNQQKVVIGKWLNTDADIYLFDEPTRGIDVGAKVEVYNIMNDLVAKGKCVIMVSSELPEILGMSDRVIVMRGGKIMGEIDRHDVGFTQENIMKAAWGGRI